MRPFQLWLPVVEYSPTEARANKDRVHTAWKRESRIWVLPSVDQPIRWQAGPGWWSWHIAVPAVDLRHPIHPYSNCIDIFHIENGQVGGPGGTRRFPDGCSTELLMAWLNLESASIGAEYRETLEAFSLWVPSFDGSDITYREESFGGLPASALAEWLDEAHTLWEEATPDRSSSSSGTSRPKHRIVEYYVPESLQAIIQCPQRLAALPCSESFSEDIISAQKQMVQIARKHGKDPVSALREAQEAAIPYITEGLITRGADWLWRTGPALWKITKGDESTAFKLLFEDGQEKFGIKATAIEEAMRSGKWPGILGQLTSIRRAWGIGGLFWSLFLEQLEQYRIQECSRCGRIIQGNQGKKYCGRDDDIGCYRRGLAARKRNSRLTLKQK